MFLTNDVKNHEWEIKTITEEGFLSLPEIPNMFWP